MAYRVEPLGRRRICPPAIRRQSQNHWLNDRLLVQLVRPDQRERACPTIFPSEKRKVAGWIPALATSEASSAAILNAVRRLCRPICLEHRPPRRAPGHGSCTRPESSTAARDRADRPRPAPTGRCHLLGVATVLWKGCEDTSGRPGTRTSRHCLPKLPGSRSVPVEEGKIQTHHRSRYREHAAVEVDVLRPQRLSLIRGSWRSGRKLVPPARCNASPSVGRTPPHHMSCNANSYAPPPPWPRQTTCPTRTSVRTE
jgi:hypothetical protein